MPFKRAFCCKYDPTAGDVTPALAHGDVVGFRTCEVVQREGKLRVLNPSQVALHAVGQTHARFCRAVGEDLSDLGQRHEVGEHRYRVIGAEKIPRSGGLLVVANHISNLDPPLLGIAVPRPVSYM